VSRDSYLRRTYNISESDYDLLLAAQHGGCAVCGRTGRTRRLHVDHDHSNGLVRGLLCFQCNALLIRRGTSPARFYAAASYLESPPAVAVLGERYGTIGPTKKRKRKRRKR
jgi:hypothetical protein